VRVNSTIHRGPGHQVGHLNLDGEPAWGRIPKCPYCDATDIVRRSPNQITCGKAGCQYRHQMAANRAHKARLAAKAVAAADLAKHERAANAQTAYAPAKFDSAIARKVKAVLDANKGRPNAEILLALGAACTGRPEDWLAEIRYQSPGLL
jgi:hypothetical protein